MDPLEQSLQGLRELVASGAISEATHQLDALLLTAADQREVLLLANDIWRLAGDRHQALQFARRLVACCPDHGDAYARASQDSLQIGRLEEARTFALQGLGLEPEAPWLLLAALEACNALRADEEAAALGLQLFALRPDFVQLYKPLLTALARLDRCEQAIDVLNGGLNRLPGHFHLIDLAVNTLVRFGRYEECRWFIHNTLFRLEDGEHRRMMSECAYHLDTRLRQLTDRTERVLGCDVICIASDEAAYLHEFIHHYLHLGFRNIFIGVNNTTDATLEVIAAISRVYPGIHAIDVNAEIRTFRQWGCYHRLFDYALAASDSSHCLFVDVDEFWLADPFPTQVADFISTRLPFDAYSFYWVDVHEAEAFAAPFTGSCGYARSAWVKSMVAYTAPLARLGVHGPILDRRQDDAVVRLADGVNSNVEYTIDGIEVLGIAPEIDDLEALRDQAWVFHRLNRSELEYATRLLKVHANDNPAAVALKSNRYGWLPPEALHGADHAFFASLLPPEALKAYLASLHRFVEECGLEPLLSAARAGVEEAGIVQAIEALSPEQLRRDAGLARQVFRGTRFAELVERRLLELEAG